jgi:hypothetical protein
MIEKETEGGTERESDFILGCFDFYRARILSLLQITSCLGCLLLPHSVEALGGVIGPASLWRTNKS